MAKFDFRKAPQSDRIKMIAEFYDSIACLRGRDEIKLFMRDLLTPDEIAMLVRRIEVAALLKAGLTYNEIIEKMKVGAPKIIAVQKSLERHGEGYDIVVRRMNKKRIKERKLKQKRQKDASTSFGQLKSSYPGMFLLNNIFDAVGDWIEEGTKDK